MFDAVDINERLGDTSKISSIGEDGTVSGAISSLTELNDGSGLITSNLENINNTVNYIKTNGTSVNIIYTITDINQTITSSTTIATVPEEFRPPFQSFLMGMYVTSDGGLYPMVCSVNNDGRIVENMHHSFTPITMSFVGTYPLKVK